MTLSALSANAGGQFVVIGESLVDLITDPTTGVSTAHAGGSAFNVAVGLSRLGGAVTFVTEYGQDNFGHVLDRQLRSSGVGVVLHERPTSLAVAVPGPEGTVYDFRFSWTLGRRDIAVSGGAACLHTGSLAALVEPGCRAVLAAVRAARGAGIAICFDPNIRPTFSASRAATRTAVEEFVELADIVKASIEDIGWLYPDDDPVEKVRSWAANGERIVVMTDGARGCVGAQGSHVVSVPARPTQVVDTVGAGDSFTAALLWKLAAADALRAFTLSPELFRQALTFATQVAGVTCTRSGSYAPCPADLEEGGRR